MSGETPALPSPPPSGGELMQAPPPPPPKKPVVTIYKPALPLKTFYCACRNCRKFYCQGTPINCIDPFVVEMKTTIGPRFSYLGLVGASKAAVARIEAERQEQIERAIINSNPKNRDPKTNPNVKTYRNKKNYKINQSEPNTDDEDQVEEKRRKR